MFEKRIDEIKRKTEENFIGYHENSDGILYDVAINEAIQKRTKSDLIKGGILFIVSLALSIPLIYYFGSRGGILAYISIIYVLYCIVIGDIIRSKITNPYETKSFESELKTTKKGKK